MTIVFDGRITHPTGAALLRLSPWPRTRVGNHRARVAWRWSVDPRQEFADDGWDVAVLDIGRVVHGAHVGG